MYGWLKVSSIIYDTKKSENDSCLALGEALATFVKGVVEVGFHYVHSNNDNNRTTLSWCQLRHRHSVQLCAFMYNILMSSECANTVCCGRVRVCC